MNSRQRRNQRVFEHVVTLKAGEGQFRSQERYFEFEIRIEEAKGWLQWRTKKKNYILGKRGYNVQHFRFRDPGLAAAFALKFL